MSLEKDPTPRLARAASAEEPVAHPRRGGGSVPALSARELAGAARAGAEPSASEAGGALGFARVYDEHFAFAWRALRLLGVAPDALEDAAQDVFTVVSRQLSEFCGRSSLRTWIFAIVQRTAANYRRRHRRKLEALVPLHERHGSPEPAPDAHAEAHEVARTIERFCASLAPDRQALFVLALLEELPAPEVARALDLPVNTVYTRVRALRAGLGRALASSDEGHDA